jgi:citronellol/citronellal dehydrogenase
MSLRGKTLFITGASRGIGLAIGLRAARDGANVVIAAKTAEAHPSLPGTIFTAAKEIEDAGGRALPLVVDVRFEDQIEAAVSRAVSHFGGIDILINNASAISLTDTLSTPGKKYDLMNGINARGTYLTTRACIPHLQKRGGHVINLSPPLSMKPKWFEHHTAYTMAKYGMSMCVLGHSAELRKFGIAVNGLWPLTTIATAAVKNLLGGDDMISQSRTPEIMADAAHVILTSDPTKVTGNLFIDEEVLRAAGVTSFDGYAVVKGNTKFMPDFFLDEDGEYPISDQCKHELAKYRAHTKAKM